MLFSELLEAQVRSRVELCDPLNHVVSPGLLSSVKSLVLIQFTRFSLPVFSFLVVEVEVSRDYDFSIRGKVYGREQWGNTVV